LLLPDAHRAAKGSRPVGWSAVIRGRLPLDRLLDTWTPVIKAANISLN
jgi:hypothetical protein